MSFECFGNMDIDDVYSSGPDNYNDIRGRTIHLSNPSSRSNSMSVTEDLVNYAGKMERCNDDLNDDEFQESIDSSQLSYTTYKSQGKQSNRMADLSTNAGPQHVDNIENVYNN